MKSKTIKLLVTVAISYETEDQLKEAIERARKCVTAQSLLGSVSVRPKTAKLFENKQLKKI